MGGYLRAASEYHAASHPDVISQQMAYLGGIYRALCDLRGRLCPSLPPLPDYEDMGDDYLIDLVSLLSYDQARQEKSNRDLERKRRGSR